MKYLFSWRVSHHSTCIIKIKTIKWYRLLYIGLATSSFRAILQVYIQCICSNKTDLKIRHWKIHIHGCVSFEVESIASILPVHDAPKSATSYKDMLFLSAHSASSRLSRYWFMTSSHCLNTPISQSHWRGFPVNALKAQYNFEQNVSIIHSLANISTNCTSRTEIQLRHWLCRLIHLLFVFILFVGNIFIQNI